VRVVEALSLELELEDIHRENTYHDVVFENDNLVKYVSRGEFLCQE
jgi:hypothetical protein